MFNSGLLFSWLREQFPFLSLPVSDILSFNYLILGWHSGVTTRPGTNYKVDTARWILIKSLFLRPMFQFNWVCCAVKLPNTHPLSSTQLFHPLQPTPTHATHPCLAAITWPSNRAGDQQPHTFDLFDCCWSELMERTHQSCLLLSFIWFPLLSPPSTLRGRAGRWDWFGKSDIDRRIDFYSPTLILNLI